MQEVEELLRTGDEAYDRASRVHILQPVGDVAVLSERNEPVGKHLGVDTEVVLGAEAREHRVGDGADAHLQAAAVVDEVGDDFADA